MKRDDATRAALAKAAAGELLGPAEVAAIYRIGRTQFFVRNRAGEFDRFRTNPAIGPKCFSGVLIHRHITGEPVYEPSFGHKRLRRA